MPKQCPPAAPRDFALPRFTLIYATRLSPEIAMSKITIRGLPDNYTLVLVDGRRVGNSRDISYRPDLGRQDLNWISPDMIERIEVVRGPMSSLYGSDAMGGVINIITKSSKDSQGGFVAAAGWDPVTGLGTPIYPEMLKAAFPAKKL